MRESTKEKEVKTLKKENRRMNGIGKQGMNFWAPLKVPALRFLIMNLNLDESLFLCVFLYLHSGTEMQAQSGEHLNLEFCHAISNAKDSKGAEGVCKNITVMNDNGISADMETKENNAGWGFWELGYQKELGRKTRCSSQRAGYIKPD